MEGEPTARDMDAEPRPWDGVPDHVLVEVLGLLDVKELLDARCVCRRWRDLAGSRAAWRHRELPHYPPELRAPVLRIAPCLAYLSNVACFTLNDLAGYHQLATTTCVVEDVLEVHLDRFDTLELDVRIVVNQLELGGVKRLILGFGSWLDDESKEADKESRVEAVARLLTRVLASDGQRLLRLEYWPETALRPTAFAVPATLGRPSLTQLVIEGSLPRPLVDFLLAKHAATLQQVVFERHTLGDAALLASLAQLRHLAVTLTPALAALPQAGRLESLVLDKDSRGKDPRAAHAAGRLLLRSVASLEELALSGFGLDETLELVAAAAASPASTLKSLYTQSPEVLADGGFASRYDGQPLHTVCLQQLAQALPSLPRLEQLSVCWVPGPAFFAALTPESAPALLDLAVRAPLDDCLHDWLHEFGVLDVLVRLPALHVRLVGNDKTNDAQTCGGWRFTAAGGEPCRHCRLGCHALQPHLSQTGFYSHDPDETCASEAHNKDWGGTGWFHI